MESGGPPPPKEALAPEIPGAALVDTTSATETDFRPAPEHNNSGRNDFPGQNSQISAGPPETQPGFVHSEENIQAARDRAAAAHENREEPPLVFGRLLNTESAAAKAVWDNTGKPVAEDAAKFGKFVAKKGPELAQKAAQGSANRINNIGSARRARNIDVAQREHDLATQARIDVRNMSDEAYYDTDKPAPSIEDSEAYRTGGALARAMQRRRVKIHNKNQPADTVNSEPADTQAEPAVASVEAVQTPQAVEIVPVADTNNGEEAFDPDRRVYGNEAQAAIDEYQRQREHEGGNEAEPSAEVQPQTPTVISQFEEMLAQNQPDVQDDTDQQANPALANWNFDHIHNAADKFAGYTTEQIQQEIKDTENLFQWANQRTQAYKASDGTVISRDALLDQLRDAKIALSQRERADGTIDQRIAAAQPQAQTTNQEAAPQNGMTYEGFRSEIADIRDRLQNNPAALTGLSNQELIDIYHNVLPELGSYTMNKHHYPKGSSGLRAADLRVVHDAQFLVYSALEERGLGLQVLNDQALEQKRSVLPPEGSWTNRVIQRRRTPREQHRSAAIIDAEQLPRRAEEDIREEIDALHETTRKTPPIARLGSSTRGRNRRAQHLEQELDRRQAA